MQGRRGAGWVVVAGLTVAAVAGCGSDDGPTATGDGSSTTTEAEPEPAELVVEEVSGADDVELPYSDDDLFSRSDRAMLFLDESLVYVGVLDGEVVARDLTEAVTGGDGEVAPMLFPVALCGDDVVVASVDRSDDRDEVVAVDVASGEQLWTARVGDDGTSPLACAGGVVVANGEGEVVGLDVGDGSVAWTAPLDPDDPPYAGGELAVIGTYDGVVGLDIETGEERWRFGDSSDRAASVQAQGAVLELSDRFLVVSPDGEELGDLPEDVRDLFRDGSNVYTEELLLAGPADAPVLVVAGGAGWVSMDGELTEIAEPYGEEAVAVGGAAGELIWVVRTLERGGTDFERTTAVELVDVDGSTVTSLEVDEYAESVATTTGLALLDDDTAVSRP